MKSFTALSLVLIAPFAIAGAEAFDGPIELPPQKIVRLQITPHVLECQIHFGEGTACLDLFPILDDTQVVLALVPNSSRYRGHFSSVVESRVGRFIFIVTVSQDIVGEANGEPISYYYLVTEILSDNGRVAKMWTSTRELNDISTAALYGPEFKVDRMVFQPLISVGKALCRTDLDTKCGSIPGEREVRPTPSLSQLGDWTVQAGKIRQ